MILSKPRNSYFGLSAAPIWAAQNVISSRRIAKLNARRVSGALFKACRSCDMLIPNMSVVGTADVEGAKDLYLAHVSRAMLREGQSCGMPIPNASVVGMADVECAEDICLAHVSSTILRAARSCEMVIPNASVVGMRML